MEKQVENFHEEIKTDFTEIKDKIELIRGKFLSKIKFDECLRGQVNDYLETYEAPMDKMNKKLNVEKRYWANQARSINMLKAK